MAAIRVGATNIVVRTNIVGTALFAVSASASAVVFTEVIRVVAVVVALALFAIGVFAFLSSYWSAVQRSRSAEIAVSQLYFLAGAAAPRAVRQVMLAALGVQVLVAFATALSRPTTDGKAGSTLAFGILVPMFGLGLNGLWCARNGEFQPRVADGAPRQNNDKVNDHVRDVPPSPKEREQNANQG
jgi:hypothetical protein